MIKFLFYISLVLMFSCSAVDNRDEQRIAEETLSEVREMEVNNNLPNNDSILDYPIKVFSVTDNNSFLAESYFLKAKILKNDFYLLRAQDCFNLAEWYAGNDSVLLFKINLELANISRFKMLLDEEDMRMETAERLLENIEDSTLKAGFMYEKALYYKKRDKLSDAKGCLYVSLGYDKYSTLFLESCKELSRIYLREHNADSTLFFSDLAMNYVSDRNNADLLILKSLAYAQKNNPDSVLNLLYPAVHKVPISLRVEAYRSVSSMYDRLHDYNLSNAYLRKYVVSMDSLLSERKVDLVERINSLNEYKIQKERASKAELDFISAKIIVYRVAFISVVFISILLFLLYKYHKNKRKLSEQVRIESSLKMEESLRRRETELELIRKEEELKQKEIDRLNKSISYYRQLNLITLPILMERKNKQGAVHITEDEWKIIVENADVCFDNFSFRLRNSFPLLTDDEIRFCCLVKMELPMSMLSEIYHIAKPSISRRKMRLKEKLNIENASFDEFISKF